LTDKIVDLIDSIRPATLAVSKGGNGGGVYRPTPESDLPSLRFLSYNIHTGVAINRYYHYLTHSWKHVLPSRRRGENLNRIADMIGVFDVVGLQETDAGSLRSEFINQVDYLAEKASFPFHYHQTNRRLGKIAQHATGLLSRLPIIEAVEHKLPGAIPGRGALIVKLEYGPFPINLLILHLALGRRARLRQISHIGRLVKGLYPLVVMGDLNFSSEGGEMSLLLQKTGLKEPAHGLHTFPSWSPLRNIDHILVSSPLHVEEAEVLQWPFSDHLPMTARIALREKTTIPDMEKLSLSA
jgi:endonuclease/exonuclease/phosphatase family metal-dependent hydrolase